MADNDQSNIRYDDFVSKVQADPAKPESTIMLSGFIGHGAEGHVRLYPDPTLGTWYDIPEADILHSMPVADAPLGGSYLWVRASAQIKPGNAAPAAPEPPPQAAMAAVAQPTPTAVTHSPVCLPHTQNCTPATVCTQHECQPTPQTHCFICPPFTHNCTPATVCTLPAHCPTVANCPTVPAVCTIQPTHNCTPATVCTQVQCPPHQTLATVCTQIACATHPLACVPQATQPVVCGILPPSFGCTQQGCAPGAPQAGQPQEQMLAAGPAMQPTPTVQTHCFICPPLPTPATVCTQIGCPTHPVVCNIQPTHNCTPATVCTQPAQCPPTPQTHCLFCPPSVQCPTQGGVHCPTLEAVCGLPQTHIAACGIVPPSLGCTQGCAAGAPQQMLAAAPTPTVQTHCFVCPPHQTLATVCTQIGCPTHPAVCNIQPTHICTPATVCTQPVQCPPHQTLAIVCTQIGCPTHPALCVLPTQPVVCGILPPSIGCTQQGCGPGIPQAGMPQAQAGAQVLAAAPPMRTSWFDCHTNMPGCTVHICAQAAQPAAVIGPPIHTAGGAAITQCCPPHTVHNTMCICPTPSAVHQCGPAQPTLATICTLPPACPPAGAVTFHLTVCICATPAWNTQLCPTGPNGVFTPFGR
ncbi:hypothetical protein [Bradyrhizobium sp.]|uniref:hypothetical protein n=1 Tax=Bradyrhizobium sp. TaxID=376 RepID=UPI003C271A48